MDWTAQVIEEFGNRLGLPGLALDDNGELGLALDDGTGIGVQKVPNDRWPEIIVFRSCPRAYLATEALRLALKMADFRQPGTWPVQAGASQRDFMLAMRIPERAFSTTSLEHALSRLQEMLASIQ